MVEATFRPGGLMTGNLWQGGLCRVHITLERRSGTTSLVIYAANNESTMSARARLVQD